MKRQLQNTQKGNLSISDYLLKIKKVVDELSTVGHSVEECDQITHILDGLLEEYDPVVMNIVAANLSDHVSVAYVHGLLLNMEMRISRHRSSSPKPSDQNTVALFTPKNGKNTSYGHSCGRQGRARGCSQQGGRGSPQSQRSNKSNNVASPSSNQGPPRTACQICNRVGHSAIDCYHRMDHAYQGSHPQISLLLWLR